MQTTVTPKQENNKLKNIWKKPWLVVVLVVVLLGGGFIVFRTLAGKDQNSTLVNDKTEQVQSKSLAIKIKSSGSVVPIETVNLSPKQAGKLIQLLVEQGARVNRGQVIARMDNANLIPQLYQAQASAAASEANLAKLRNGNRPEDIAAAQARVEAARGRLDAARSRLALTNMKTNRFRSLQTEGAISSDRFDEVVTDDRSAQADLQTAQANLVEATRLLEESRNGSRAEDIAQAEAQLAQAIAGIRIIEVQIEDTIIRAPFAGIITQKYANAGAFVTPTTTASASNSSSSTSIVAIANGLEIIAKVPEVDISQIKIGQEVEIVADAFPTEVFKGKVRLIAPEAIIEQNVTSFQVRVTLETGKDKLQSGMNTDLRFIGKQIDGALVVPTVAIVTQEGKTGLLIADEKGKPKFQPVTIGSTVDNQTQILSGAKVGDRVFVKQPDKKP
ncbi:MAG: efflux RND transporter periplasmic adaptor subunit [Pseudanabaena sp. M135S2SP2A07QC]|jgi:HlyD family secretion protein|nr:efflux RND transporter periplasmic adaptor subunit [Pseudanabaena sp. M090S1SP2A07QC]MCA6504980.1 efflux RND transporter periplasmic adaptor subunit [Pseudanabaena sp. M172S2SP2A07QC]MCA6518742.1 efflux RND transporter periplasmic adaptor subunit [Pseudanabaena sp. M110S1SP2A07QC]MCA6520776.1 efflux RND transporter periplasmic adaptor subunit [Pseudanabaena sp. M051S1SP2A07QC]MCA6526363.1 efflux RND transporter periplasmic adaptor subunit [Pseudanabaena sp. M179S2SP2A07QC]MCA6532431.1 efflu